MSLNLDKSTWKRAAFGDVVRNLNVTVKDPEAAGINRIIAMEHLDPGELKISRWGNGADGATFTRRVRPGQTLFGKRRAYQRKVAYAEFDALTSGDILVFESDKNQLLPELLPFLVQSDGFYNYALGTSAGSLSPRTNWRDLSNYKFDLPPIDEQKRLANLLWAIERHRLAVSNAALGRLEARMLESLLRRDSGPLVRIDSLGSVLMGRQRSPKYANGDHMVSYLRVANIGNNKLRLGDIKKMNFTPEEQEHYRVLPNDILISEGQSRELVGQSALVASPPEPICFQNTLIRFRSNVDVIYPAYAQAMFRACLHTGVFVEIATQTTSIAHLGVQRFARLKVPVPSLSEQESFLARFDSLRAAIESTTSEILSLADLREALLRDIFAGVG